MPLRLPLFPLPVVLFPGTPLPLHIFEPRYRQLLADCLAGDRRFGITPPGAEGERPGPGTVGCVAEVRVNQELPDGRSNIVVLGGSRFVVRRELNETTPYQVAEVEPFDDETGSDPPADAVRQLGELFLRYHGLLRQLHDVEPEEVTLPDEPLALSFHVAAGVECDPGVKQRLLAERHTGRRVEALLLLVPILTSGVESALRVHHRAHGNGQGTAPPDLVGET
ncbi:MAG TPA: LON peptidase substrate-binding domain-containing protein [Gemmatimonadales bacterium]|nr:LON peptidase substrate-binding domain-containing protein [Gemmatimonadales bacterium]